MNPWWCPHLETSDADCDGYGICWRCGAVVVKHLTRAIFDRAMEALKDR